MQESAGVEAEKALHRALMVEAAFNLTCYQLAISIKTTPSLHLILISPENKGQEENVLSQNETHCSFFPCLYADILYHIL